MESGQQFRYEQVQVQVGPRCAGAGYGSRFSCVLCVQIEGGICSSRQSPHPPYRLSQLPAHLQRAAKAEAKAPGRPALLLRQLVDGVQVCRRLFLHLWQQWRQYKGREGAAAVLISEAACLQCLLPQELRPPAANPQANHSPPACRPSHHPTCPPERNMIPSTAAGTQRRMVLSVASAMSSGWGRGPR